MSKKKRQSGKSAAEPVKPPVIEATSASVPGGRRFSLLWIVAVLAIVVIGYAFWAGNGKNGGGASVAMPTAPVAKAEYVGAAACTSCHATEAKDWQGSQHAHAMQHASEQTVLGDFNNARFTHAGITSTFFRRDGKFMVRTDGPDGKLADFEAAYTFGVEPLQQYLIQFPGGRLQALGIAWDSRPKQAGGQRWFHLYPEQSPKSGSPLHWTGIEQNWNYQCADCHSSNLHKGYDAASDSFKTTATDRSVGCESCHGPGSQHIAWAKKEDAGTTPGANKGLVVELNERKGVHWTLDPRTGNAIRSRPRDSSRELETCARCHARRGQFSDEWQPGQPFGDAFRTSLLTPGLYHVDGQQRDEVFIYASFLQSKMHAKGVTCSDCHEPHGGNLRAPGNGVCAQCHAPSQYDAVSHTHHAAGSKGAECASCHMPTTTYMVVDPRHDHSFRIPRPDRSITLGVPNACNNCHTKQSANWAASALKSWFPQPKPGFQTFAEAFHDADRGAPGAQLSLQRIAEERTQPGIVRASALNRLGNDLTPQSLPAVRNSLGDPDPLVRAAAAHALTGADPATRAQLLPPQLGDPIREVRMEAARSLAGEPEASLSASDRERFAKALAEYIAGQNFNADRPEALADLGTLYALRGDPAAAETAYRRAIERDPTFVQGSINLADLFRAQKREAEAEKVLRAALERSPRSAPLHHALGLSLVRQQRVPEALAELARAVKLAPEDASFAYVYGVALNDTGKPAEALRVLEAARVRSPYDRGLLFALVSYQMAAGNLGTARKYAGLLQQLEPGNPDVERMVRQLGATPE